MSNRNRPGIGVLIILSILAVVPVRIIHATGEKLGKIFIKAGEPDEQQFANPGLEDTVKDMKRRPGQFILVDDEADADFLLIVINREEARVSGEPNVKLVTATLSVRDGAKWKPGIKISKVTSYWLLSADRVISDAEKWVKSNLKR
jgi:hypothetical protein